jgi:O-antigen/teichoic acid export membrane protein
MYIYPLKFLYSLSVDYLFGQRITGATIDRAAQLNYSFAIYGAGFALLNLIVAALYAYSYRQREALQLDELERHLTRSEMVAWLLVASVGLLSTAVALFTDPSPAAPSGWVYMILPVIMPIFGRRASRTAQRIRAGQQRHASVR